MSALESAESRVVLTADQILSLPPDIVEKWLEVPEWGGWIKIRSLTARENALVKGATYRLKEGGTDLSFAEQEKLKVEYGVCQPKMTSSQVATLFKRAGPAWQRVINALDEISNAEAKETDEVAASFPNGGDGSPPESADN